MGTVNTSQVIDVYSIRSCGKNVQMDHAHSDNYVFGDAQFQLPGGSCISLMSVIL